MNDPRGEPIDNLRKGCLWPIARSFLLVGLLFAVGFVVTMRTRDGDWFFIIMIGGVIALWICEKTVFRERNAREKIALDHLLGKRGE